ncbi:hypothetical protein ACIB24_12345 [Spongisporangium articulatum]|uniref:Uncharacterized protein n=1 Tax=Spongisporangium articulatum TaxID=3362603 RepID=A0ABW8AN95_9ACTN
MSGGLGILTLIAGAVMAVELPFGGAAGLVATGVVLVLGGLLMVRSVAAYRVRQRCTTCGGAGTVYSAEWNDWRAKGPVQNIRELCPACEGRPVPTRV